MGRAAVILHGEALLGERTDPARYLLRGRNPAARRILFEERKPGRAPGRGHQSSQYPQAESGWRSARTGYRYWRCQRRPVFRAGIACRARTSCDQRRADSDGGDPRGNSQLGRRTWARSNGKHRGRQERRFHRARRQSARQYFQYSQDQQSLLAWKRSPPRRSRCQMARRPRRERPVTALRCQRSTNIDFRFQCPMDWTAFRNFEQPASLSFIDGATQLDFTIDPIEKTLFGFALNAILGMNPIMLKTYCHVPQVPTLALCIQPKRHRCASAEACEKQF